MMEFRFYLSDEAKSQGLQFVPPRPGDAGFDLPSLGEQTIPAKGFALLHTGVHVAIPTGWVGLVRDRSSIAMKGGACVAGVIDAGYRGEVKIAMHNLSDKPLVFAKGERLAQCVLVPHFVSELPVVEAESLETLGSTTRGTAGFGSTGR